MSELSTDFKIEMLRKMMLIRAFEEKAEELYMKNLVHGTMHLSVGEEAVAVGAIFALDKTDYITSTHRGHGHMIAKGGDVRLMFAEFLGKETGYCKGRGGSMHIASFALGNLGANGIVSSSIPIGTGAALALKMQKKKQIVLSIFGDGASNEGMFYESLNMAKIWNLPIVYLCENNMYAMSASVKRFVATNDIADKANAFGMPGVVVDGMDVIAVYEVVKEAAERARNGEGPTLIEAKTYRYKGHSKSDLNLYRTKEEIEEWKKKDPINTFVERLKVSQELNDEVYRSLQEEVSKIIEDGVKFAIESPEPSVDSIFDYVYAEEDDER
jgi:pyruvate dehydrogenase E1 component alpha subunit